MAAHAVLRERAGGEEAALLGEVFERAAGEKVAPDVAAPDVVDARQHDEVGVRPDDVERIELDAAQSLEHRPHTARAAPNRAVERVLRHERASRRVAGEDQRHAARMVMRVGEWGERFCAILRKKMRRPCHIGLVLLLLGISAGSLSAHPGSGIVVDRSGSVYFIDTAGGVWRIDPAGKLTSYGGPRFHWLALDERGVVSGRRLPSVPSGELTPVGTNPTLLASSDVPIAIGPDGSLYYPEFGRDQKLRIMRFTPSGATSVHAIVPSPAGSVLRWINGLTASGDGSLYYTEDRAVKKIDPRGVVSTVASNVTVRDCVSIPGIDAPERPYLRGLAVAADGAIYVAASGCGSVVKIAPRGEVSVVLQSAAPWSPTAVAVSSGGVYVLEYVHTVAEERRAWVPRVRRVSPSGAVTTIAVVTRP
jgi:streptogramin lyase